MDSDYPLEMSSDEITRLRVQSDLFRPDAQDMLNAIGVQPGWRCLDLCCGIGGITDLLSYHAGSTGDVIGLDSDAAKIAVAENWAHVNGYTNVRFVHGDAFATGFEPRSFDLVHTRFALSIVPGGAAMLPHLLELVRPGGVVLFEEVEWDSVACHPENASWDRAAAAIDQCFSRIGSDLRFGRKLPSLLTAAGAEVSRMRPCNYALRHGQPMHHHVPLTVAAMRASMVEHGVLDGATVDRIVAEAHAHLEKPDTITLSFTMFQVVARIPPST